jgi:acyl-CoA reductase-like NAD-dependent aldehyde dehydrogenase
MGPVQNKKQFSKLCRIIDRSVAEDTIRAGGFRTTGHGYFISPTIVLNCSEESELVSCEQFGPILPVKSFRHEDEVVSSVNGTQFGLSASVWSGDPIRARQMARKLDVGVAWINKHLDLDPTLPISPSKQSGVGTEFGLEGVKEFTQPRLISG